MSTETQKVDVLARVRAGDMFLSPQGHTVFVMRILPGGLAVIREEMDGKPCVTKGKETLNWLKALPRLARVGGTP